MKTTFVVLMLTGSLIADDATDCFRNDMYGFWGDGYGYIEYEDMKEDNNHFEEEVNKEDKKEE